MFFFYRKYVIFRLPTLKFLDSYEVSALDREEAAKDSQFYNVISYKDEGAQNESNDQDVKSFYTPLSNGSNEDGIESTDPKGKIREIL